ncbi:MAG TPA: plasmid pRiA4b ORF-3 family protein [Ktedonobacterales bacterium]|nr:plasmid pRiA4b ORF-3 family protein [Ktedonobacterales bacterium]
MSDRAGSRKRGKTRAVLGPVAYQLHVALQGIEPPIWRQVSIPGQLSLYGLHECLQVVMGWQNYHLHQFLIGETIYTEPSDEWEFEVKDDRRARLERVAPPPGGSFVYTYDFGDNWKHQITVEAIVLRHDWSRIPWCLDGKRACPPEDCGSVSGYAQLLEALGNRRHPDHRRLREWVGPHYDPEVFSLQAVNSALAVLQAYILP